MAFLTDGDLDLPKFLFKIRYQTQQSTGELTGQLQHTQQDLWRGPIINSRENVDLMVRQNVILILFWHQGSLSPKEGVV